MFIFINALSAFAGPGKTTYQAKIVKPDGYPLEETSVNFKFTILDPVGSCVLYSETYSSVNMSSTGGLISFALGSGVKTYPTSATTFEQVFSNITPSLSCDTGGPANYTPTATDIRKIVMQFHDGSGWQTLPAMSINAVPYAMYANEAVKLNGLTSSDFVQLSTVPTCAASEALRYTGAGFTCVAVGNSVTSSTVITALGYTPADGASVTTLTSNVSSVSSTVFSVSSTVTSLQNSVAASFAAITSSQWTTSGTNIFYNTGNVGIGTTTPSHALTIQKNLGGAFINLQNTTSSTGSSGQTGITFRRTTTGTGGSANTEMAAISEQVADLNHATRTTDLVFENINNGSFAANPNMIIKGSGNIGIGTTTPVTKLDVSGGVRIGTEGTTCAPALAGTLRYNASNVEYCNGTSWQAFGVSGAGIINFNGSTSGTQTFATGTGGTAPNFNTSNGVHTLNIPLASTGSVTAGLISNADYTTFSNKITSSAASIAQVLGYVPADNAASGTYAQKANNLSDLTNVVTARTNLGLGTFATANTIDLGSASATGTLAIARLPSFTGDATIAVASNTIILSNSGVTAGTYTKVTVDAKGRVTSSSALASSDVTTALGYTPASATASTQWTTSGSAIHYNTGNVGVGTTNPLNTLHVAGQARVDTDLYIRNIVGTQSTNGNLDLMPGSASGAIRFNNNVYAGVVAQIDNSGNAFFTGNVGIGTTAPTARLHLAAGTSTLAPFKFTSGTLLTSPQSGTIEYDGANFYLTDGTNTRRAIAANTSPGTYDNVSSINSSSNITLTPTGSVVVSSTTASTNSTTGALVVKGGLGVAGDLNVAGTISGSAVIKATGYRANQGAPDAADSSTVGYAFGQDGDTGLFSPGSGSANGVLAFYSNNSEKMRITSGGALGIGTSNPVSKLEVANGAMTISHSSTSAMLSLLNQMTNGKNFLLASHSSDSGGETRFIIKDDTAGAERFVINSAGNVGIGTTAPTAPIETAKNFGASGAANSILKLNARGTASSGFGGSIDFLSSNEIAQNDFIAARISSAWEVADNGFGLSFFTKNTGANGGATVERMRISNSGNVGIGTTAPSGKLQIDTSTGTIGTYDNGDGALWTSYSVSKTIGLASSNGNYGTGASYKLDGDGPLYHQWLVGGGSARMVIDSSGNVGIGTTTPSEKLEVNGKIKLSNGFSATNAAITYNDYTDYLFIGAQSGSSNQGSAILLAGASNTQTAAASGGITFVVPGASPAMVIKGTTGNVGIGTTTPSVKLDVAGGGGSVFQVVASSNGTATPDVDSDFLIRLMPQNGTGEGGHLEFKGSSSYQDWTIDTTAGDLRFFEPNQSRTSTNTRGGFNFMVNPSTTSASAQFSALKITKDGNVGVGITSPTAKLDVNGQIAGKSYKTRLFQAGGRSSTSCTLSASNTANLVDQFCDLSVTFTLTDPASVQINYTIATGAGSVANGKHLVTGIDIDGTVVTTVLTGISQQELVPYWSNSQTHFADLAVGSHTIKVKYRTPAGGTSNPSANDWENRILQVMILGYQ